MIHCSYFSNKCVFIQYDKVYQMYYQIPNIDRVNFVIGDFAQSLTFRRRFSHSKWYSVHHMLGTL